MSSSKPIKIIITKKKKKEISPPIVEIKDEEVYDDVEVIDDSDDDHESEIKHEINLSNDNSKNIEMVITKKPEQPKKKNKYKKFSRKILALKATTNNNLLVYGMDNSSISASKTFVVSNDETIFNKIKNGENFYYENIEREQEVAFGIDMDITNLKQDVSKKIIDEYLWERMKKIIYFFKNKFKIDLELSNFLITKSKYCSKKNKHSFHMKILGYKFPCPYVVKYYFSQIGLTEKNDGVDSSVYRTGLIRLSFCSKKGQKRPLLPYYLWETEPNWIYELNNNEKSKLSFFINSKWTFVKEYESVDITEYLDMCESKKNVSLDITSIQHTLSDDNDDDDDDEIKNGFSYHKEHINELLKIVDINRFSNYNEWMKLLWILKNQKINCFDIFDSVSSKADKYPGQQKIKELWENSEPNKYPYTIATLKYWAKIDCPNKYECKINDYVELEKKNNIFDKTQISEIIKKNLRVNSETLVISKERTLRDIIKYINRFFIKLKNMKGKVFYLEKKQNETIIRDKKNFLELMEDCNINFTYVEQKPGGDENDFKILEYPVSSKKEIHNAGRFWLASPLKSDIGNLDFYPGNIKTFDTYNIFKGISITREACQFEDIKESIKPIQDHIFNIWCKKNQTDYEYTIKLLAFYLQNLDTKSGVALVISGDKGSGKSCIIEKFLKIYGEYGKIVPKLEDILGNFNSILKDSLMVYINEATFTGDKGNINKLRNLVTSPKVNVNEKFMPQYTISNFSNFIIDGNSDQLVCNHGEERRFFILETDNKWKGVDTVQKQKYFEPILKIKPQTMANWLYGIDLTGFNQREIPETNKVKEARIDSFDSHEGFFFNVIDEGVHIIFKKEIPIVDFYNEYLEYTSMENFQIKRNKFAREIKKKLLIDTKRRHMYQGNKVTMIKLKSIEQNRNHFETIFGKLKWSARHYN